MKTLLLTENLPPIAGGSGRWFWELYSRLPKENLLIVADESENSLSFDKTHNLNIIRMPLKSTEWGLKSIKGLTFYFKTILKLRKIIRQHGITHVHTGRVLHEGVSASILSIICGIKYLCYVHGEDVETAASSREHNLMVKFACKKSQGIICNSHNSAEIVRRLGHADDSKIHVLHPGVDAKKFLPAEEDLSFKEKMGWVNRKVIITVGRLQHRKGQDVMIKAMVEIIKNHPDALYAVIGKGNSKQLLEDLVNTYQLQENVQLLDELTDEQMIQCYQQCDLFILPNRTIGKDIEGFGMVLVEAQSCAKAVIAGDSGGTKETMKVGSTGFIVDCTNPLPVASEVSNLLNTPEKLIEIGLKGREYVEAELDWSAHVSKAKNIFNTIF